MHIDLIPLLPAAPGHQLQLQVLRFGQAGAGPKAYIQAALHADEVPALLVAQHLREQLLQLQASGLLLGEVVLVPFANPLGLAQQVLGQNQGRFDLRDGINFNRSFAELTDATARLVQNSLGPDAASNTRTIRQALLQALHVQMKQTQHPTPAQQLKHHLLQLAVDADVVLDLHCDSEASVHLYAATAQAAQGALLGSLLGARAVLLADESGDTPFDEACARPWQLLQARFKNHPVPLACFSATVELRGEADTHHATAAQDARACLEFLRQAGVLGGPPLAGFLPAPAPLCQPTLLAASEPIAAPRTGVVVFHLEPGAWVAAGAAVADIVCVETGKRTAVCSQSAGVLYARVHTRWALAGQRIAKVAGSSLQRTGKLLSA
jgi:uncharacterized protein